MTCRAWFQLLIFLFATLVLAPGVRAQSFCASDGQPRPVALLERFINADCDTCWTDATAPRPAKGALALDWIVPGSRGEDAPLSAAATRDGLARLTALGRATPAQADSLSQRAAATGKRLRVAHGLPFNNYLAASIELKPGSGGPWSAWLALVETIPADTEGTPVERNLVRNLLQPAWNMREPLSKAEQIKRYEARPMMIPEGARAERLRVVGWVEDAKGRIQVMAQSQCVVKP